MVWYDNKEEVRKYLAELNKEKKVSKSGLEGGLCRIWRSKRKDKGNKAEDD